jgi:hypothetical protein
MVVLFCNAFFGTYLHSLFATGERVYMLPGPRCVRRRVSYLLGSTHPYDSTRESTRGKMPSRPIRPGLCRIAVMDFRECTLYAVW